MAAAYAWTEVSPTYHALGHPLCGNRAEITQVEDVDGLRLTTECWLVLIYGDDKPEAADPEYVTVSTSLRTAKGLVSKYLKGAA